jgi:hypothetical protein
MKTEANQSPAPAKGTALRHSARVVGVLVAVQGVVGLVAPDTFVALIRFFQVSPVIYAAAVIRIAIGIVLVRAAHQSRVPVALRALGLAILLGGALTPFFGARFARVILGWWAEGGPGVVRGWALASLAIGLFIGYATSSTHRKGA